MYKLKVLLIPLALFCAGCVSVAEMPEQVRVQAPLPQGTQSIAIRSAPVKPGTIKNVDSLADPSQLMTGYVRDALMLKQPTWQIRSADERGASPEGDIVATVEFLTIDGGSAALRFFIGFSAGSAQSKVRVVILDKTGKELASATLSERTMCPLGSCPEGNEATIKRNLRNLAGEVAEFIENPTQYEKKGESKS